MSGDSESPLIARAMPVNDTGTHIKHDEGRVVGRFRHADNTKSTHLSFFSPDHADAAHHRLHWHWPRDRRRRCVRDLSTRTANDCRKRPTSYICCANCAQGLGETCCPLIMTCLCRRAGVPKLGDITFFARALSVVEMQEIMVTGFTLQAVSAGKLPYNPPQTAFDTMAATQSQFFATAEGERANSGKDLAVEGSLSRQDTQLTMNPPVVAQDASIVVPETPNCPAIEAFGGIKTCRIMHEWDQEEEDTQNQRDGVPLKYWNLIQPAYRPAGAGPKGS